MMSEWQIKRGLPVEAIELAINGEPLKVEKSSRQGFAAELPVQVGGMLLERGLTIASAESCTGGMFAQTLTDIPGISAVFDRGIVTYSNRAKMEELGVRQGTLAQYGAVSAQTAVEMAEGIQRVAGTRIGVSVTGVAGPGGGSAEKPVGLVYVCAVLDERRLCRELRLNGDRTANRTASMYHMFHMIGELIKLKG
ncbi:CinA family protein [Aminipila butyrica]|uniref:CinA family protein n=1 Tax=Aminipila butyrica TaxID=433296 RepID=A0A858BTX4_9FIRM|nr:nicotinamide-nucleotide amidohydrolase family protein [Aminipila butyrica]QIB69383.1 CinA family protein [Aminipila butyrica]